MARDDVILFAFVVALVGIAFARSVRRSPRNHFVLLVGPIITVGAIALWTQRSEAAFSAMLGALTGLGGALTWSQSRSQTRSQMRRRGNHSRLADSAAHTETARWRAPTTTSLALVCLFALTVHIGGSTVDAGWFGGGITHGNRASHDVALTFDDGPNVTTTIELMNLLDRAKVRATFFIVGKALDREPGIARMLIAHGHLLANHSYEHDQWRWLDPTYPELARTQRAFQRNGLACPAWYRPPHGQRTPFVARAVSSHHMRMAMWDVSATDWATTDAHRIAQRVLSGVRGGSIILLHDGLDGNPLVDRTVILRALPEILKGLAAKGLHPVRLDQLLGGPATVACD